MAWFIDGKVLALVTLGTSSQPHCYSLLECIVASLWTQTISSPLFNNDYLFLLPLYCTCYPSSLFPLHLQLVLLLTLAQPSFFCFTHPMQEKGPMLKDICILTLMCKHGLRWTPPAVCYYYCTKDSIIYKNALPLLWTNVHQNPHQSAWRHLLLEVHRQ